MQFSEDDAIETLVVIDSLYQTPQVSNERAFEQQTANSTLGRSVSQVFTVKHQDSEKSSALDFTFNMNSIKEDQQTDMNTLQTFASTSESIFP